MTLRKLKVWATLAHVLELFQVIWILNGLNMYNSEENECNWETKFNFGFVAMFMAVTLGMILVIKWFFKALEVMIIIFQYLKRTLSRSVP